MIFLGNINRRTVCSSKAYKLYTRVLKKKHTLDKIIFIVLLASTTKIKLTKKKKDETKNTAFAQPNRAQVIQMRGKRHKNKSETMSVDN